MAKRDWRVLGKGTLKKNYLLFFFILPNTGIEETAAYIPLNMEMAVKWFKSNYLIFYQISVKYFFPKYYYLFVGPRVPSITSFTEKKFNKYFPIGGRDPNLLEKFLV